MMIDVNAIFELCMFIASYNEPDYQPCEKPYYRTDLQRYTQDDMNRFSNPSSPHSPIHIYDEKVNEFWIERF